MTLVVRVRAEAELDLVDATLWYEIQRLDWGTSFLMRLA